MSTHERITRTEAVVGSSDRSFGLVFAGFCTILGVEKLWRGSPWGFAWLAAAVLFAGAAFLAPWVLAPLNRVWLKFGLLLHRVISPIILGLLFYAVVTPMALLVRMLGKDLLRLRRDRQAASYWIEREPPGPPPDTMKLQF